MTKERLKQILDERDSNPVAYQKDGYRYFEEALPLVREYLMALEIQKEIEEQPKKLVELVKIENKKKDVKKKK